MSGSFNDDAVELLKAFYRLRESIEKADDARAGKESALAKVSENLSSDAEMFTIEEVHKGVRALTRITMVAAMRIEDVTDRLQKEKTE